MVRADAGAADMHRRQFFLRRQEAVFQAFSQRHREQHVQRVVEGVVVLPERSGPEPDPRHRVFSRGRYLAVDTRIDGIAPHQRLQRFGIEEQEISQRKSDLDAGARFAEQRQQAFVAGGRQLVEDGFVEYITVVIDNAEVAPAARQQQVDDIAVRHA